MLEIKTFQPEFIKAQVDLIWEVTDNWKFVYQTSYETVEKAYKREGFDPNSRLYAFEDETLVGFVASNISEDSEGKKTAQMRLPIARDDNQEALTLLMNAMEAYLKAEGVSEIRSPAGEGLGNTLDVVKNFGFEEPRELFRRTNVPVDEIVVSGNTEGVTALTEADIPVVEELFKHKMGMPEQQGKGFFDWLIGNSKRKNDNEPNTVSLQLYREDGIVKGFSYLMKSDHDPSTALSMPVYFEGDGKKIIDRLYSAHLQTLSGVEWVGNYLLPRVYETESLYQSIGFSYQPSFMYTKNLSE